MMFNTTPTKIPGCFEIAYKSMHDLRGSFTKTFHIDTFSEREIKLDLAEEFFIYSHKNVFRGMHFQNPPTAIHKLVYCVIGHVTDYIVDLRKGSPTYLEWISCELKSDEPKGLFVPKGCAHGYLVQSDYAIMQYKSSGVFDPKTDDAIAYTSFSFAKDIKDPILSDRDIKAIHINDFKNNFIFEDTKQ